MIAFLALILSSDVTTRGLPPRKLSCAEISQIGRKFVRENDVAGNPMLTSVAGYSVNNSPIDGWSLRFIDSGSISYGMKMDNFGSVEWFEKEGGGSVTGSGLPSDWKRKAIQKAVAFLKKMNVREPIRIPQEKEVQPNWMLFFPILVDGRQFFGGNVGYQVWIFGSDYRLRGYHRENFIPKINTKVPAVRAMQAVEVANQAYPSDADYETRSGTHRYVFHAPTLSYYWSGSHEDTAKLVWYFKGMSERNTGYAFQGGSFVTAVDATTGKIMKIR